MIVYIEPLESQLTSFLSSFECSKLLKKDIKEFLPDFDKLQGKLFDLVNWLIEIVDWLNNWLIKIMNWLRYLIDRDIWSAYHLKRMI